MNKLFIWVKIFDGSIYNDDWPPTNAIECAGWFADKVASIPPENRDTATVIFDADVDCDGVASPTLTISYLREETDAEAIDREVAAFRAECERKTKELRALEELKAKYEVDGR